MHGKRFWQTIRLCLMFGSAERTRYLKEQRVFASIGENCSIMDRKVPLYANLIKIGNNVHIASKVDFVTHDITHVMLNGYLKSDMEGACKKIKEKIGCIEIGDNVFIGTKTTILYDVKIGSNVIVAAGALVNKDVPDNSVVGGIPAKVIGSFDDFLQKRLNEETYPDEFCVSGETVDTAFAEWIWARFNTKRRIDE